MEPFCLNWHSMLNYSSHQASHHSQWPCSLRVMGCSPRHLEDFKLIMNNFPSLEFIKMRTFFSLNLSVLRTRIHPAEIRIIKFPIYIAAIDESPIPENYFCVLCFQQLLFSCLPINLSTNPNNRPFCILYFIGCF